MPVVPARISARSLLVLVDPLRIAATVTGTGSARGRASASGPVHCSVTGPAGTGSASAVAPPALAVPLA
jgi:hypothetical protein